VRIEILYQMQYAYAEAVSFSRHIFRLFPKADRHLKVRTVQFQTNLDAVVSYRRDLFDNEVAVCFYPEASALLSASLRLEVELEEKNAFNFLLDGHALHLPFTYEPHEQRVLTPYLQNDPSVELPFWQRPVSPQPTIATLVELNRAFRNARFGQRRLPRFRSFVRRCGARTRTRRAAGQRLFMRVWGRGVSCWRSAPRLG
jgi:Bacterial transglutaminase-like N-terminal region